MDTVPSRRVCGWSSLALMLALGGSACTWKGEWPRRLGLSSATAPAEVAPWRPQPATVRIYPATRFTREGVQAVLEARIEFRDQAEDPVKAVGRVRIDLFAPRRAGEPGGGKPLYTWERPLLTLADQRAAWDSITAAYLFRLKLDDLSVAQRSPRLVVTFMPTDGPRLDAEAVMGPGGPVVETGAPDKP